MTLDRIVIYPKGRVGEDMAYLLNFIGIESDRILFIDDSGPFGLEDYLRVRESHDVVCVASEKYFFDIARKLDAHGIAYCNGASFIARRLDEYFAKRKSPCLTVGVITSGPSGSKHRGEIENILRSNGIEVVFLCCDKKQMNDAKDRIGDSIAFILREKEILKRITFASVIISECGEQFHPDVTGIYIPHTVAYPSDALARSMLLVRIFLDRVIENNRFIAAPGKAMYDLWDSYIQHVYLEDIGTSDTQVLFSSNYKIKPLGLPTLDRYKELESNYKEELFCRKVFVCLNADITSVERAIKLVSELLGSGYKVLYRPHPIQRMSSLHQVVKSLFCQNVSFVFDESLKITLETINNGVLMVTDVSSLSYSYAIGARIPVVLYVDSVWKERLIKLNFNDNKKGNGFYEPRIHKMAETPDEVLFFIKDIQENRDLYYQQITKYVESEIYNFGCASQSIAELIMDILKYKGRAIK